MTSEKLQIEKSDGTVIDVEPADILMFSGQLLSAPLGTYSVTQRDVAQRLMDIILRVSARNGYPHCSQLRLYLLSGVAPVILLPMVRTACSLAGYDLANELFDMRLMS